MWTFTVPAPYSGIILKYPQHAQTFTLPCTHHIADFVNVCRMADEGLYYMWITATCRFAQNAGSILHDRMNSVTEFFYPHIQSILIATYL